MGGKHNPTMGGKHEAAIDTQLNPIHEIGCPIIVPTNAHITELTLPPPIMIGMKLILGSSWRNTCYMVDYIDDSYEIASSSQRAMMSG